MTDVEAKWTPVAELLAHIAVDDDLMLRWALRRYGDIRGDAGRAAAVGMQRQELAHLIGAVQDRAAGRPSTPMPVQRERREGKRELE